MPESDYDALDDINEDNAELTIEQVNARNAERRRQEKASRDKETKAKLKRLDELEERLAEVDRRERTAALASTFESLGLKPKFAKFYPADAESDEAAVRAWALEEEFLEPVEVPEEDKNLQPFKPMSVQGSQQVSGNLTVAEAVELARTNPREAEAAYRAGKVLDADGNPLRVN